MVLVSINFFSAGADGERMNNVTGRPLRLISADSEPLFDCTGAGHSALRDGATQHENLIPPSKGVQGDVLW